MPWWVRKLARRSLTLLPTYS